MSENGNERLSEELRRWATRPTILSPGTARTRVLAQLPLRRRPSPWRLAGAGLVAAAALAMALVIGHRTAPVIEAPPPTAADAQRTIVHQLSSGTKLYIVMRPGITADGS